MKGMLLVSLRELSGDELHVGQGSRSTEMRLEAAVMVAVAAMS